MKYIKTMNIWALLEVISATACSISLLYLLTTGSIYRLIAPNSYVIALLWMLSLGLTYSSVKAIPTIWRHTYHHSYRNTIIYGLCTILLSPSIFYAHAFSMPVEDPIDQIIVVSKESSPSPSIPLNSDGIDDVNHHITLTSSNYYDTILKVSNHLDDYVGYTISATGYISYHDQSLEGNNFTLARDLMICCIADMSPFGLATEYNASTPLLEHTWYTMKGTISTRKFHGMTQPFIINSSITTTEPIDGYIFPN